MKKCTINEPKMVNFQVAFTNLYEKFDMLSLTLCMSVEQWISGFARHQKIMVSQYQPRAMIVILTWPNLITLICLIGILPKII